MEFDFDKDAARYAMAARRIAKYARSGQTHMIGLKHLRTAVEALGYCSQHERAMKIVHDAAEILRARKDNLAKPEETAPDV